jgi:hypothetical protein
MAEGKSAQATKSASSSMPSTGEASATRRRRPVRLAGGMGDDRSSASVIAVDRRWD